MGTSSPSAGPPSRSGLPGSIGVLLLAVGLLGHVYAAHAMGGSRIAYTHHILGFGLILLVTGGLIAGAGYYFWRSRWSLALLVIGAVQALIGIWVAVAQWRITAGR
jgi:hypothetical protein